MKTLKRALCYPAIMLLISIGVLAVTVMFSFWVFTGRQNYYGRDSVIERCDYFIEGMIEWCEG